MVLSGKQANEEPAANSAKRQQPLLPCLSENESMLRSAYTDCSDIVFHSFLIGRHTPALLVYHAALCDTEQLDRLVLAPLIAGYPSDEAVSVPQLRNAVPVSTVILIETCEQAIQAISNGHSLLLAEGLPAAFSYGMQKYDQRSVEEPSAESTVRGPREGFTESIHVNIALLLKRLKSPKLKIVSMTIGEQTHTAVKLVYMAGVIDPAMVEEVTRRVESIQTDSIMESEYIEEWIVDQPYSPFPQLLTTERPDVVCANLVEGRFALLTDGTPFALIGPVSLFTMLQSVEDYYQSFIMSTFVRWLRYVFFVLSLLLPSFYVAITTYHQEMIPTVLLLSIAKAREEIPFPALVEALIMEIAFEALREAGIRLPKQVGAAVSIVGALIIGQAATSAGIVSAPMVIIVATTGIASFMIPRYAAGIATRLLRFPIMLLAGTLGLIGMMLGVILIVIHLCRLRSFGLPYLSPLTPTTAGIVQDVIWRSPVWKNDKRHGMAEKRGLFRSPIWQKQSDKT